MSRSKQPGPPAYRLHKGSGQGYVIVNGRRQYLGVYNSPESLERYARFVAELAAAGPAPVITPSAAPAGITVVEVCARYLDFADGYYRKHGKPTAHVEKVKLATRRLTMLYGSIPAADFGPKSLKAFQHHLAERGQSRNYCNDQTKLVRAMFKWAVGEELVPPSVYHGLTAVTGLKPGRSPAKETEPVKPVSDAVVDATLPYLPEVVADMVRLQRLTGCRPGELCQLRPMDVDRSGEVWTYRPASHKTEHHGRSREIFIGPKAQAVLRPYLLRPADAACFSPIESEAQRREARHAARNTPLSCGNRPGSNRKRRPKREPRPFYDRLSYAQAVRRGVDRHNKTAIKEAIEAGLTAEQAQTLPHWHPNQLRHTAASEIRKGFGLEAAQVILGHAKADITQVYAERDHALAAEIARRIG